MSQQQSNCSSLAEADQTSFLLTLILILILIRSLSCSPALVGLLQPLLSTRVSLRVSSYGISLNEMGCEVSFLKRSFLQQVRLTLSWSFKASHMAVDSRVLRIVGTTTAHTL